MFFVFLTLPNTHSRHVKNVYMKCITSKMLVSILMILNLGVIQLLLEIILYIFK